MPDRTVHARRHDGAEVVRYDRAGRWYVEWPPGSMKGCVRVSVSKAARLAAADDAEVFFGQPGGRSFDAAVRRLRNA